MESMSFKSFLRKRKIDEYKRAILNIWFFKEHSDFNFQLTKRDKKVDK